MGKIRVAKLGDEHQEKEQQRRADARREGKKAKKTKVEGVGLKGGERTAVVEGGEIKEEYRNLIEDKGLTEKPEKNKKASKKKTRIRSKRYQAIVHLIDRTKIYGIEEAVALVKKTSLTSFDGRVELHVNLNPLALGEKKDMRGSVNLPHGTGKQKNIAIADDAVLKDIEAGKINFDVLVAHPSMMPKLAKFARVLGPKGLMPNPKTGTVADNPEKRVQELSGGQTNFKTDPTAPIVHMAIGKVSFEEKKLAENITAVLDAVGRTKIIRATLTSTMGPGIKLQTQ